MHVGTGFWLFHLMFVGILSAVLTFIPVDPTGMKPERRGALLLARAASGTWPARDG